MLYDGKGNDRYPRRSFMPRELAIGMQREMLIDESGNDVYNAIYYPRVQAFIWPAGYLYDGSGDDAYYSRNGPGQGAGHDWGQGILIDGAGTRCLFDPGRKRTGA